MQYPYIPNSSEAIREEMLRFIGVNSVEDIYSFIPKELRMAGPLNLPEPILSESALKRHVDGILGQNISCAEYLNFLGAGCYDHYVPAVCDEVNNRAEFLSAYSGDTYADHGKSQAFFEFTSMMGELLNMDVVCFPTYDGAQAASTALMMSMRITGKKIALVPETMNPGILLQLKNYCEGMEIKSIAAGENGQIDLKDLQEKLSGKDVAVVFLQNPSFLGFFEEKAREIGELAHDAGAQFAVYADPSSLGIVMPPADYGADICCGDIQPLGIHMSYGSGLGGYLATRQEEEYVMNYPYHFYAMYTNEKGEFGFMRTLNDRTSFYVRDQAIEYLGTCVGLWAITAAVYLGVTGPKGMRELGENIVCKSAYAKEQISKLPGARLLFGDSPAFMEFVVNFDESCLSVKEINKALLSQHIFGGYDLSREFPSLGQSMLICVTEKTDFADIDALTGALSDILKGGKQA